ncbi:MAG: YceD family protein [Bacteroidales bacterium]
MKTLKPFEIAFVGLSTGVHEFSFDLNDDFFSFFEGSEISRAALKGTLILLKKNNMLDLEFIVEGKVELNCDRCLDPYWQSIEVKQMLYVKFGDRFEEQSDEVVIIPSTESHLEVAQYFYEYIILSLPGKRIHPGGPAPEDNCDAQSLAQLEKYLSDNPSKENQEDKPADSRWDALNNLKFNN